MALIQMKLQLNVPKTPIFSTFLTIIDELDKIALFRLLILQLSNFHKKKENSVFTSPNEVKMKKAKNRPFLTGTTTGTVIQ